MGYMKEKVAYLRGLAEGMEIGGDNQGKLLKLMIETMDEMAASFDDDELSLQELDECIDDIYEELDTIEDYVLKDEEDDKDYFDDEDFVEVECPHCGETVYFDQEMLQGDDLICPNCNETILPKTVRVHSAPAARRLGLRLSKKWLAPLFRGFHSSLAPTARPGSYAGKPLLRKAFCGFDAHPPGGLLLSLRDNSPCVAKSDYSLRGAKPSAASGGRSEAEAQ